MACSIGFMDVNYGAAVKDYLSRCVSLIRLHKFDPHDVQFDDALVSSAIVVYRKSPPANDHTADFSFGGSLLEPRHNKSVPQSVLLSTRKWGTLLDHSGHGNADNSVDFEAKLSSLFTVSRGIATGANEFFILERDEARKLGIDPRFLKPILPSPRYLQKKVIEPDAQGYPLIERQLVLIDSDLPEHLLEQACPQLWEYLRQGEKRGIRNAYLIAKRSPWYRQEQREPAQFLCTYMGRSNKRSSPFRFIWNRSQATAPNVYLLLYPRAPLQEALKKKPGIASTVFDFLQEIDPTALISQGRTYGGGLYKLEPRELMRINASALIKALELDVPTASIQPTLNFAQTG